MFLSMILTGIGVKAQCAMCRASVENSISENSESFGASLNTGILYLFVMPYILVALFAWLWFRGRRKNENNFSISIRPGKKEV
ncbi:MAG: hypothetical protein KFF73_12155 [Cyclobacteriaceae bacterium]|nr:hypothetical protein [Cyclobacteriaceae bacterium]